MKKRKRRLSLIIFTVLAIWLLIPLISQVTQSYPERLASDVLVDKEIERRMPSSLRGMITGAATGSSDKIIPVIVMLKDDSSAGSIASGMNSEDEQEEIIREKQDAVLGELRVVEINPEEKKTISSLEIRQTDLFIENRYTTINGFSGLVTASGLEELRNDPLVKSIAYDYPVMPTLSDSILQINASNVWNITVGGNNINGTGITVCVIDTGIDYAHPSFGGCTNDTFLAGTCSKVLGGYDYGNGDTNPMDVNSHGTHVAGIVASENDTYRGVAPGAKLVALKVFTDAGVGSTSNVISAIDWCKNNRSVYNISVITISLAVTNGGGVELIFNSTCDSDDVSGLASAASGAAALGIFVDASAGNLGSSSGITSPGCGVNVTSVGSVTKTDGNSNYNTGPNLDMMAPGSSIVSTTLSNTFGSKSGTSMAAPHVAGAAALLIQYHRSMENKNLTPTEIDNKLKITGVSFTDTRNNLTFPRINILEAIKPFINFTSPTPANNSMVGNSITINATADTNVSIALLEWNNGTINNMSMTKLNNTLFTITFNPLGTTVNFRVHGNDSAGLWGASSFRMITVDNSSPVVAVYRPVNNSIWSSLFYLNISITNLNLTSSYYNITNSTGNMLQSNINSSIDLANFTWTDLVNISPANFTDGNYSLVIFVNDSRSNNGISNYTFRVDKTVPALFGGNKTPETVYNTNNATFFVNVTDVHLNETWIEGNWSGAWVNYTLVLDAGSRYALNVTSGNFSNQEAVGYRFYANDSAGNTNRTELYSFVVQNRVPVVNITSPANTSRQELGGIINFTAATVDNDSDALTYLWIFDGATASTLNASRQFNTSGNYLIWLNVTDGYANVSASVNLTINDSSAPEISNITYSKDTRTGNNETINLTIFDYTNVSSARLYLSGLLQNTSSQSSLNYIWRLAGLSAGSHTFVVERNDTFGHATNTSLTFSITSCTDGAQNGAETGTDCGGDCSACSSSSSSSSSGGGGGASSSAKSGCEDGSDNDNDGLIDYPADPGCESAKDETEKDPVICKQSWSCTSWNECKDEKKSRVCTDANDCAAKKAQGKADILQGGVKPSAEESCEIGMAITTPPAGTMGKNVTNETLKSENAEIKPALVGGAAGFKLWESNKAFFLGLGVMILVLLAFSVFIKTRKN